MAVGTLSIATTAPTSAARGEIGKLRAEVRGLGPDAAGSNVGLAQLEAGIRRAGNTAAEFEKKFGKIKPPSVADPGGHVDLSGEVDRYKNKLEEARPIVERYSGAVKTLGNAMKILGTVGKIGAAVGTFVTIFQSTYQWGLKATKSTTDFKDAVVGLLGIETQHARHERQREERQRRDLDRRKEKLREAAELQKQFETDLAGVDRQRRAAMFGEENAQFQDDSKKFGLGQAGQLRRARVDAANAEMRAAERKRVEEERIEKLKERDRKWQQAQERRREQRKKDEETLAGIQRRVTEFGLSTKEKERRDKLRDIQDPALRAQADRAFRDQAGLERIERQFKRRIEGLRDDRKTIASRDPSKTAALDARTAEGFSALRDSVRREELKKLDQQLQVQTQLLNEFRRGNQRGEVVFEMEEG